MPTGSIDKQNSNLEAATREEFIRMHVKVTMLGERREELDQQNKGMGLFGWLGNEIASALSGERPIGGQLSDIDLILHSKHNLWMAMFLRAEKALSADELRALIAEADARLEKERAANRKQVEAVLT